MIKVYLKRIKPKLDGNIMSYVVVSGFVVLLQSFSEVFRRKIVILRHP